MLSERVEWRVGWGSDVHRLEVGEGLWLGGVFLPCQLKSISVSDGDVLLHAIVDAVLGAGGLGDIGDHFPESAVKQGERSSLFLEQTVEMLAAKGGAVVNADCVVDLERPKLGGFKPVVRDNVAALLRIAPERVNIKAKTGEGLGIIGTGAAIGAQAVVMVRLPV
jgi:2-C-methyl-D-erythritol 2,4-cyclodiphosphate synthase